MGFSIKENKNTTFNVYSDDKLVLKEASKEQAIKLILDSKFNRFQMEAMELILTFPNHFPNNKTNKMIFDPERHNNWRNFVQLSLKSKNYSKYICDQFKKMSSKIKFKLK